MHLPSRTHLWHWGTFAAVALIAAATVAFVWMPHSVKVVKPVRGPAVQAVYATGTVEATVMMPIAPRSGARLTQLVVDEGAEVKKGQVLAKLEDADLRHTLNQLVAQEAFAKRDFDRDAALVKQGVIPRQVYDRARSDWQAAAAATARARVEAGYMTLVAPDDGRIIRRDGEIGQLIPANQPLFWLSGRAPLRISADVDEEDIGRIRPGQDVLIRADAFSGQIFHGRVQSITPKGDPVARSYRVRIDFTQASPLMIGMTAETNIIVYREPNALLVPASAVVGDKVWVVASGRLAMKSVLIGAKGASDIQIVSGLSDDDLVVLEPDSTLHQGAAAHAVLVHRPQ